MRLQMPIGHTQVALLCCLMATPVLADGQIWPAPHGMFGVSVDENDKLQVLRGIGSFENREGEEPHTTSNVSGNFVLIHDVASDEDDELGGFAERTIETAEDRLAPLRADLPEATADSTVLFTDEPGFNAVAFPDVGFGLPQFYTLHANFVGQLLYHDGSAGTDWGPAPAGEVVRVMDYTGVDNSGADLAAEDSEDDNVVLELILDASTEGVQGRINLDTRVGFTGSIHSHLAYELSRPDGDGNPTLIPSKGAYMIELFLSSDESGGTGVLGDSDPLFIVFDNQTDESIPGISFANVISAAVAIPEPTTAMILAGVGSGIVMLRRRSKLNY